LVKTLHPLESIGTRISEAGGSCVRLAREADASFAANGANSLVKSRIDGELSDPVAATIAALAEPLDFPPLAAGIVPGDRVAIAVDQRVPSVAAIVRGAVEAFANAGIDREAISIVTSESGTADKCRAEFADDCASLPHIVLHDPEDKDNLCMVGLTKRGEPLLINRTIFDADVVLPIGWARANGQGVYDSLFPRFSDAEAILRYRTPANRDSLKEQKMRNREINEAGRLIGVAMSVAVIPGTGDRVAQVLAGQPQSVAAKSAELARERWSFQIPHRVSLVIATVTTCHSAQQWDDIGRALATAEPLLEDGGAVAVCTNLDEPPGRSLGRLIGSSDLAAAQRKILHEHAEDSEAAWQIARALQRGPVYFLGQLNPDTVEELGLAPVADIKELVRMAGRHESCAVVDDAQNAVVSVEGECDER
jgi:nickel-dependent lactate racemase